MATVLSVHLPCLVPWKQSAEEDVWVIRRHAGVFVVADGVTRRGFTGSYPHPSSARLAAEVAAQKISQVFGEYRHNLNTPRIRGAFGYANDSVRKVNEQLGLWDNHDYWGRDLAGTVAAGLAVGNSTFWYGFIADCGIAQLRDDATIRWYTPNMLAEAETYFPSMILRLGEEEAFKQVRREFRNRPDISDHPTYGTLTGEGAALHYVFAGSQRYQDGDVLAVYSDGAAPFVLGDPICQHLLVHGTEPEIHDHIKRHSSPEKYADEKTLIVVRTQE